MSRIVLISVPLKKTDYVDVRKPIEEFVSTTFGTFTDENADAVEEFSKMRELAVLRTPDRRESGLEPLLRYYDQLSAIEAKLPIPESAIVIHVVRSVWKEGSLLWTAKAIAFESIKVLFNVAALYSQIAKIQNFESDEGLKAACKQFQSAAGIFRQVKDLVYLQMSSVPQPDLGSESLYALAAIMVAQAQECLYHKTISDQMRNPICAMVSAQTGDLYAGAARLIADPAVAKRWDEDFTAIVTAKESYFLGMAEFHWGQDCKSNAKHGESIARYRLAYGYVNDAAKKGTTFFQPGDVLNRIGREMSQAEKDNNVIYSDLVPALIQLDPIGRSALAKATPLSFPASTRSQDLFAGIVPKTIRDAVARYESQREALVQTEVGKLREATLMLNWTLSSLNLPAAIEDASDDELPASLLAKAEAVRSSGGVDQVTSLLRELPELRQRNKEVLTETTRLIAEEEQGDTAMRERFQDKWTRRPSSDLFKEHRAEIAKYDTILTNVTQADEIVRAKYDTHVNGMTLLSKSETELIQSVPKGSSRRSSDSKVLAELKGLMEQINSLKASRDTIEASFCYATVDISARFMLALDGSISEAQLSETYSPLQQQVADSVAQQQILVERINAAHQRFISESGASSAKEGVLKDLAAAHDALLELKENLQEGAKFYNDLTRLFLKSQWKVVELIFARITEKDDYVKELQRVLAKSDPAPPPSREAPKPSPNPEKDYCVRLLEKNREIQSDHSKVQLCSDNSVQERESITMIRALARKEEGEVKRLKALSTRLLARSQEAEKALIVARKEAEEAQASAQEALALSLGAQASAQEALASAQERANRLEGIVAEFRALFQEKERRLDSAKEQNDLIHIPLADVKMTTIRLGGGAYGEVKVGYWRGCPVAVKTFFECLDTEYYLDLFKQEIAICSRARHSHIVFLCGVTTVNDTPLRIVTELLESSLSDVIKASVRCKEPLSPREQIDLASGMTAGISYLHQLGPNGILHGDIRSTNVVVTSLMEAKICDLGAARFAQVSLSAGPLSPEYLAPERSPEKGRRMHNTKMADVYSLGVTVIKLMIGQHPVVSCRIERLSKVAHPDVKQMCLWLIEEDLSARPGADECLAVLERIQESRAYNECAAKRMVKGKFHGEGQVSLVLGPWAQRRIVQS